MGGERRKGREGRGERGKRGERERGRERGDVPDVGRDSVKQTSRPAGEDLLGVVLDFIYLLFLQNLLSSKLLNNNKNQTNK